MPIGCYERRKRFCTVDGCSSPHYGRDYCYNHYARFKRKGTPGPPQRLRDPLPADGICKVKDCTKPIRNGGWCDRHSQVRWKYRIDPNDFEEMRSNQNYSCMVCRKPEGKFPDTLNVDHDHKTGRVRGLLCSACNRALGNVKDNVEVILNLVKYLQRVL
jgi:hypothetical protein